MLVEVTMQNILQGKRHNCHLCPVSLAVARALNLHSRDVLMTGDIYIRWDGGWRMLSDRSFKVRRFAARFDKDYAVRPFTFVLEGLPLGLQVPSHALPLPPSLQPA